MPQRKTINLDAGKRLYTKDGVNNFFYPVSRQTHLDFSVDIIKAYCEVINKHNDNADINLYKVFGKYFIAEVISVFQGLCLKKGLEEFEYDYQIPTEWRSWPALLEAKPPKLPPYIKALKTKLKKPNYIKKIFNLTFLKRLMKVASIKSGGMNVDGLKIKPITDSVIRNDIISTQRTHLITRHAEEVHDDVVFCRSTKWFDSIDVKGCAKGYQFSQIDKDLLEVTKKIIEKHGIHIDQYLDDYFADIIKKSMPYLSYYIRALCAKENLPQRLWIGTSGNIWDSMLKVAVKRNGGYVCGHDHGTGHAHFASPTMGIIELWGSDEFYTFSSELEKVAAPWSFMGPKTVKVIEPKNKEDKKPLFTRTIDQVQKIFLLSTVYEKDRGRLHPLMPDIVQLDWQARFIAFMKNKNYDVIIKSHPESSFKTPKSFEDTLGAQINSERFEEVFETADLFIFDYICTSTFTEALKTNIPIMIIDFGDIPWSDKALKLAVKRCAFIKGTCDKDNRLQIDWDCFNAEVKNATDRSNNREFYEYYYK